MHNTVTRQRAAIMAVLRMVEKGERYVLACGIVICLVTTLPLSAVTATSGLVLVEKAAPRMGLWGELERRLAGWAKGFDWLTVIKSAASGLLSGSQGTYATEEG